MTRAQFITYCIWCAILGATIAYGGWLQGHAAGTVYGINSCRTLHGEETLP